MPERLPARSVIWRSVNRERPCDNGAYQPQGRHVRVTPKRILLDGFSPVPFQEALVLLHVNVNDLEIGDGSTAPTPEVFSAYAARRTVIGGLARRASAPTSVWPAWIRARPRRCRR